MVSNMKNKLKAGNTLSFVLILLIIVSIISMALVYSISYTTRTRLDKSHKNYETIILQNKGYEVLNLYIEDLNSTNGTLVNNKKKSINLQPWKKNLQISLEKLHHILCYCSWLLCR